MKEIREVHVEFICRDGIYEALLSWAKEHKKARLMLLVDSCPHCETHLFPDVDLAIQRYKELAKTSPIGLHVHLFYPRHWWINKLTPKQQEAMIRQGLDFLRLCDISTTHFSAGNWRFNLCTLRVCALYGLTEIHWHEEPRNKALVEWGRSWGDALNFISAKGVYTHDWSIAPKGGREP